MRIVHLVVTSPPYGLLKTYAEVLGPSITVAGSRASVVFFVCSDGDAARLIAFFHGHRAFVVGGGFPKKTEARSEKTLRRVPPRYGSRHRGGLKSRTGAIGASDDRHVDSGGARR